MRTLPRSLVACALLAPAAWLHLRQPDPDPGAMFLAAVLVVWTFAQAARDSYHRGFAVTLATWATVAVVASPMVGIVALVQYRLGLVEYVADVLAVWAFAVPYACATLAVSALVGAGLGVAVRPLPERER